MHVTCFTYLCQLWCNLRALCNYLLVNSAEERMLSVGLEGCPQASSKVIHPSSSVLPSYGVQERMPGGLRAQRCSLLTASDFSISLTHRVSTSFSVCSGSPNVRLPPIWDVVPRAVPHGRSFRNRFVLHKAQISGDCSDSC